MERTVKPDATVLVGGAVFEPKDQHSAGLMKQWIGGRVKVREHNHWGTEMEAALRFPVADVLHMAHLRMRPNT